MEVPPANHLEDSNERINMLMAMQKRLMESLPAQVNKHKRSIAELESLPAQVNKQKRSIAEMESNAVHVRCSVKLLLHLDIQLTVGCVINILR